jgi:hypothetical protein
MLTNTWIWKQLMDDLTYFDDITVELNADALMDRIQLRKSLRGSSDFLWAVEQAKDLVHPRAVMGKANISIIDDTKLKIGDQEFTSRILRVNLDSCELVYPFIATIGPELETVASKQERLTRKFFLELIGDYVLTNSVWQIEEKIKEKFSFDRNSVMTPGSLENWPITQQVPLFNLFGEALKKVGVELTSSMLMKPRKSISGISFKTDRLFINCQLCQRDRCPGRRAKYMPEKFAEYGLPVPPVANK